MKFFKSRMVWIKNKVNFLITFYKIKYNNYKHSFVKRCSKCGNIYDENTKIFSVKELNLVFKQCSKCKHTEEIK